MQKLFKYLSSGVSFLLLYFGATFIIPMILIIIDYTNVNLKPTLFGQELLIIQVNENTFLSEGTGFGALLSFALGLLVYYLSLLIFKKRKVTPSETY